MSVNPVDPKWLEILKASGWQTTALAFACLIFIYLVRTNVIPTTESPLWVALPALGAVVFGCLALAAILDGLVKAVKPATRIDRWRSKRHDRKMVAKFIPYMTDDDRTIIAHLLHHKQKMFQADHDGGYAATLISRGIVRMTLRPGQVFDQTRVPFAVPDHIWEELERHRDQFPYKPKKWEGRDLEPWIIPWNVR